MQQLEKRNTYTPTDVQLFPVRKLCDLQLNRDESLSVADLKTFSNNPEGILSEYTQRSKTNACICSKYRR